jgi:hypothetical protein
VTLIDDCDIQPQILGHSFGNGEPEEPGSNHEEIR